MALFPAYSSKNSQNIEKRHPQTEQEEAIVLSDKEEDSNIYLDELQLLQSTSNSDQSESSLEKQSLSDRQKKRKGCSNGSDKESVNKKKRKRRKKSSSPKPIFVTEDEFYIDKKLDYGNMRVSTLYIPGRPQYHYEKNTIGVFKFPMKKKKTKVKRYFQVALTKIHVEEQLVSSPQGSSNEAKSMATFINISDSSSKLKLPSECMLAKAATFMEGVRNNPNNIDLWMEYVHFQKEFFALEKCHGRVKEENAQNLCHDKQLEILNKALILNPYDMSLLSAKVTISEQRFSNAEYSDILKELIKNADKNIPDIVLCHLWCWYVEAVQCSMALCYVSRITDMYQHAVATLSKHQGSNYQSSHVEITYRFGLFLRQCGMWEHLWTLIKLNAEMNLDSSGGVCPIKCFQFDDDTAKEHEMANKEAELTSCGLPLSTVWVRVERLRSAARWRAAAATGAHDPQRCVQPAQLQPMLRPVTRRAPAITLAVHILRLLKVPLLPLRTGLLNALHPSGIDVRWQYDAIEDLLPLLYAGMTGVQDISQAFLTSARRVVAEFVEQPHYFSDSEGYLTFVNDFFLTIADWFSQRDKTAILVWWIRFQTLICSLNISDKEEGNRVRKQVQRVLKLNRGDAILYGEFACLESVVSGRERGLDVALAVLRNTKPDQGLDHSYLSRCYVELLLKGNVENKSECQTMAVNVLISLALGKSLPKILTCQYLEVDALKASEKMQEHLNTLLLRLDSGGGMTVCDHWLPGLPAEWAACCIWLRYLTAPRTHLHRLLHKLLAATHTPTSHTPATDRRTWLREIIYECFTKVLACNVRVTADSGPSEDATSASLLRDGLRHFPHNAQLGWQAAGGSRLTRGLPGTAAATGTANGTLHSLALLFQEFVRLYSTRDERDGLTDSPPSELSISCSNRLRAMLVRLCRCPSLRRAALLWKMRLRLEHNTTTLYLALDDCPWNKELYVRGCQQFPGEWRALLDLVLEKELRLHAMPEELEPL